MSNQRSALNVTSRYDNFLFAPVCVEPGAMPLSVLSALARMNIDPWEEAARLATLPAPDAQRILVSTLNPSLGKRQTSSETEILAARLVALLPEAGEPTSAKAETTAWSPAQRNIYWLVWMCIAIAISHLAPHQPAPTASTGDAASASSAISAADASGATPAPSNANSQTDSGKDPLPTRDLR